MKKMFHRSSKSQLVRGFVATLLGSGASKVILVLATFVFAHMLTKMEFGEFSFVRNTLNTILCICALNFTGLCTKFTVEATNNRASLQRLYILFLFSLAICALLGICLLALPQHIMLRFVGNSDIIWGGRLIGLLLPLFILQPLIEGVLRGLMKFKLIGLLQTLTAIFFIVIIAMGIHLHGLSGAIGGLLLYYTIYAIASVFVLYRQRPFNGIMKNLKGFSKERDVLTRMIIPIFLMSFIEAPVLWVAQVFLSQFDSMEAVGSMTAIFQVRNMVILIPSYLFVTFTAFASKLNAENDYQGYFSQFGRLLRIVLIVGVTGTVLLSVLARPILRLFGPLYTSDYPSMIISNIEIPLLIVIGLLKIDLIVQEHQKQLLYSSITWNITWIILLYAMLSWGQPPLPSFFVSQLASVLFYLAWVLVIYRKDKKRLLYGTY